MSATEIRFWPWLAFALAFAALFYALSPILMPFAVAAFLAYLGNPLVERLMRLGLRRNWAASLAFFTLLGLVVIALVLLTPILWKQFLYVESKFPVLLRWFNRQAIPWMEGHLPVDIGRIDMQLVNDWLASFWQSEEAMAQTGNALSRFAASGMSLLALLGLAGLVPVVTFYLLMDWDKLLRHLHDLLPRHLEPTLVRLAKECDEVLAAFIRGQLLVMLSLGVIYAVGLQLVGLKLALIIGMVAGLCSIIPYFGFTIGIVAATIAAVIQFGRFPDVVWVWVVFAVGQALEGWILQPWLVGDRIGLHPVAVIFAIMAGGQLFGFVGMLIALPVAAIVMVLLRHLHGQYRQSRLYQGGRRVQDGLSTEDGDAP